jgi:hypothetical protein
MNRKSEDDSSNMMMKAIYKDTGANDLDIWQLSAPFLLSLVGEETNSLFSNIEEDEDQSIILKWRVEWFRALLYYV